ncbi:hypothetical protein WDU94_007739 [Cyamophila willieti]
MLLEDAFPPHSGTNMNCQNEHTKSDWENRRCDKCALNEDQTLRCPEHQTKSAQAAQEQPNITTLFQTTEHHYTLNNAKETEYKANISEATLHRTEEDSVNIDNIESTEDFAFNSQETSVSVENTDETSSESRLSLHSLRTDLKMEIHRALKEALLCTRTELCTSLEPNARFRFTVHFDLNSCSKTFNSYVVQDCVFLNYEAAAMEDQIPIVAIINYPNIELNPNPLNYQTVPLYSHQTMHVILTNKSPFPVEYQLMWSANEWSLTYTKCDDVFVKKFRHEIKKYTHPKLHAAQTHAAQTHKRRFQSLPQKLKQKPVPTSTQEGGGEPNKPSSGDSKTKRKAGGASQVVADESSASVASKWNLIDQTLTDPNEPLKEQIEKITTKFVEYNSEMNMNNQKTKMADYRKLVNLIIDQRFKRTSTSMKVTNQIVYIVQPLSCQQNKHTYQMQYSQLNDKHSSPMMKYM